jgi:hypothetical protein
MNFVFKQLSLLFAVLVLLPGCATRAGHLATPTAEGRPENVFSYARRFPATLQRVAVLPLVCEQPHADLPEGCEALNPVLLTELTKAKRFEVVAVNSDNLRSRTGRSNWTAAEALPADFFESLRSTYGCDAVLFCELTTFRAYAPLAIGWRLKLVDTRTRQILWATDEVFDAGRRSGGAGAAIESLFATQESESDDWALRNSPRQFGQYAAARLCATLPVR